MTLKTLILTLVAALAGMAQQTSPEPLRGRVSTENGTPVAGAVVTVRAADGRSTSATTARDGGWTAMAGRGPYEVSIEAEGYQTRLLRDAAGPAVDAILAARMQEGIVRYQPVVDPERTHQADFISQRELMNLPVNRRNYLSLAALTPGVAEIDDYVGITDAPLVQAPQSGLSFGGNNGRGNVFWLDGGENNTNTGGVRNSISQEAVSEFQVWRSNYSAEFGGGIGGIVNIISRSGGDQIHGNLFGFLRHSSLQARNFFDRSDSNSYTRSQTGGTLSLPLNKGRTAAFFAFERLQSRESNFVALGGEDQGLRRSQADIVGALQASADPGLALLAAQLRVVLDTRNFPSTLALFRANRGVFPFGETTNLGSIRVDHRFSDNHNAFVRLNLAGGGSENSRVEGITGFSRGVISDFSDQTFLYNDSLVLSARLVSETRVLVNRIRYNARNQDTIGPSIDISGYGLFGQDYALPSDTGEWHGQVQQNFFFTPGRHSIRFGADINPVHVAANVQRAFGGRFTFGEYLPLAALISVLTASPDAPQRVAAALVASGRPDLAGALAQPLTAIQVFNIGAPAVYIQGFGDPRWSGLFARYNFFINDVFRVNPRLTVNAGVRYELENAPSGIGTDPNNVAPRFGLAWDVTGDRKTVLRAGYGLFYLRHQSQIAYSLDAQSGRKYNQVVIPLSGLPGSLNRSTGQPLNSSDIFRGLQAQGILGRRPITAADLAPFGIVPNSDFPFQVLFQSPDSFENAWAHQASFEIERAVGSTAILAGYNFNRAAHLPRLRDLNVRYGPPGPLGEPSLVPLDPLKGQVLTYESAGNSFYHALFLQATRRFSRRITFNAHYTLSKSIDEATDINFLPNDSLNVRKDRGLSTFDQRHRLVASGVFNLPGTGTTNRGFTDALFGGWVLAPIFSAHSGRPFNVVTGIDFNSRRPAGAGRNIGHGPDFFTADARLSRSIPLTRSRESLRLELIAEGFNLANRTNFRRLNNTVGDVTVNDLPRPLVGRLGPVEEPLSFVSAFDARQFQFALKLHW